MIFVDFEKTPIPATMLTVTHSAQNALAKTNSQAPIGFVFPANDGNLPPCSATTVAQPAIENEPITKHMIAINAYRISRR